MLCFWSVGQLLTTNTKPKFATFVQLPVGQLLAQLLSPALGAPKVVHDGTARLDLLRVEEEEAVGHKLAISRVLDPHQRGQDVLLGIHLEEKH